MIKIYQNLLGDKVKVYVNDLVIKSKKVELHVQYLEKDFKILYSYNIKLNPDKYTFRVISEKFLRHLVTQLGIEIDPTQISVVLSTKPSKNKKQVRELAMRIEELFRFLSGSTDKCRSIFSSLPSL